MLSEGLHPALLAEFGRIIEARMGWSLGGASQHHLERSLERMAQHIGLADAGACLAWLAGPGWTAAKADCCARFLTVGETYFFREPRGFDLIVGELRARAADPALAGTPLRVWSAGCCTGEEPYSIAMSLLEAFPALAPGAVSILATDVNQRNLDVARAGMYRNWSFRGVPARIRQRFFSHAREGLWRIADPVRAMVQFAQLNLALPCYPSPANGTSTFDVILCRNVLMYFTPAQRKLVVQRLRDCLPEGGWLVVNASEAASELFEGFTPSCHPDAIHYRKGSARATPPAPDLQRAPVRPASAPAVVTPTMVAATAATQGRDHAPAPAPGSDSIAQLRERVAHAMAAGDGERARACLQQIIFLQPLDVAAHYMLGIVLGQSGRKAQGQRKFAVAAQLLEGVDDANCVEGTDGLPAGYLRASLRTLLERGSGL